VRFAVDQVLDRRAPGFEQDLFYNLNRLQENVGAANVFPSDATLDEYNATIHVAWRILPEGTAEDVFNAISKDVSVSPRSERVLRERLAVLKRLKPEAMVTGTDGFVRYFGAMFGDDFVAFENVRYGNAIYIMFEEWRELSKRTRVDLLAGKERQFVRIEHRLGWEKQLRAQVEAYRTRRRGPGCATAIRERGGADDRRLHSFLARALKADEFLLPRTGCLCQGLTGRRRPSSPRK
jgi:hypothetical protein